MRLHPPLPRARPLELARALALLPLLAASAAQAAPPAPTAALVRCGGALRVEAEAPAGAHLNPDAPLTLRVGGAELRTTGGPGAARLPWSAAPDVVLAQLELGLCSDTDGTCWTAALEGALPAGRPPRRTALAPAASAGPPAAGAPSPAAAAPSAPARWGDVVQVYDFTAVWCPPCQAMKAEVLDDTANAADLAGLQITPVDADLKESWALKTRYAVTGYPTLIAVDATGAERGRLIGYPGEAALLAWLGGLRAAPPIEVLRQGPPQGVVPAEAAVTALDLARRGEEAAATAWLQVADPRHPATWEARLALQPAAADIDALTAAGRAGPWIFDALAHDPARLEALRPLIARLPPEQAADALLIAADGRATAAPGEAAALRLGARLLYEGLLVNDLEEDRPLITSVAQLRAETGDLDGALALLAAAAARFPAEFTFHHAAAGLLVDAKRWTEAEVQARAALAVAQGDQRLRAVQPLAKALDAQKRRPEAIAALQAERDQAPKPGPGLQVRTSRYLKQLDDQLQALEAGR